MPEVAGVKEVWENEERSGAILDDVVMFFVTIIDITILGDPVRQ